MKPIKAGIVGFGRVGEGRHLPSLRAGGQYEVVGVCDITPKRREAAAAQGLKTTGDLAEFLAWPLDLVVIATHSSQHYPDALQAIAAGKHVLLEKPMTVTAAEAAELVAAAAQRRVVLTVRHNRHFDDDYRMVKAAVQEGLLGDLVLCENRSTGAAPAVGFGTADFNPKWRIAAAAGGGTLLDFGPHWVEQCLDLLAGHRVVQVFADVRHVKWGDVDDLFRVDMVFDHGVRAMASKIDLSYFKWPYKWFVVGTQATLHGPVDGQVTISGPDYELRQAKMTPPADLYANLAAHLREGEPLIITAAHALRVMQVLDAARESARLGKSVDVSI